MRAYCKRFLLIFMCICFCVTSVPVFADESAAVNGEYGVLESSAGANGVFTPATKAPLTPAPTKAPVTETPVTTAPTTAAPVTKAPVTTVPATTAPVTEAPVTTVPATEAPVTTVPATTAPVTEVPVTAAPATEAPVTTVPATTAPATEAPVTTAPATEVPENTQEPEATEPVETEPADGDATPTPAPEIALALDSALLKTGSEFSVNASGLGEDALYGYELRLGGEVVERGETAGDMTFIVYRSGEYVLVVEGMGVSAELTLDVAPTKPTGIKAEAVKIGLGEEYRLNVTLEPWYAETTLKFSSSSKKYVAVDAEGFVTGARVGGATITVKTANGLNAKAKVTVAKKPASLKLEADRTVLGVGETAQLTRRLSKSSYSKFWQLDIIETSVPDVIALSGVGVVTAVNPGTATVRLTIYNGLTSEVTFTVHPAPDSIRLPETCAVSVKGPAVSLAAILPDGTWGDVTYETSDKKTVTVDADGNVKGIKPGTAEITASTFNGHSAVCIVTVLPAPTKLKLNYSTITVGVGESFSLEGIITPSDAASELRFRSGNSKYAKVDEDGNVTALKKGTVYVYAYTYNNKSAKCKVVIRSAPEKVTLSAESVELGFDASLGVGESVKLTAGLPKNTAADITWAITAQSAEGVATLDDGYVTAAGIGWVDVTATTHNGKSDVCRINVKPATTSIAIKEPAADIIGVGQTIALECVTDEGSAGGISYSAEPAGIVSVDNTGRVKGLKAGAATVTATSFNGASAAVDIEVWPAPKKVTVTSRKATLGVNDTYDVGASIPEGTMASIVYSSNKKSVATVDENGVVTAVKKGTATITVKTHNGKKTTVTITVKAAPLSVAFKNDEVVMHPGDSMKPGITVTKNSAATYTYSSGNTDIVEVSSNGTLTAKGVGATVITVTTHNGLSDTMAVRVVEEPYVIEYTGGEPEMTAVGIIAELPFTVLTESGEPYEGTITVTSSKTSVLAVNSTHMLGKKAGNATVTVKAGNITRKFNVKVKTYSDVYPPEMVSHRGNGMGYPENSLEAVLSALETGAAWVEIDIRRTKDGVIVLCHDATVDRTSDGSGYVADMTYEELLALDFGGTQIRTLEEVVAALSGTDMKLWLEFKTTGVAEESVSIINKYGMRERTMYNSYLHEEIFEVLRHDPESLTALTYTADNWDVDKAIETALEYGITAVYPSYKVITATESAKVHSNGLKVSVWTVNNLSGYNRCISVGVDYIITDKPGYLYDLTY